MGPDFYIYSLAISPEEGCFFIDFKGRRKTKTLKGGSSGNTHCTGFVFIHGGFFLSLLERRCGEKAAWGPEQQEWHQLWVSLKLIKLIFLNSSSDYITVLPTPSSAHHMARESSPPGDLNPPFQTRFPKLLHIPSLPFNGLLAVLRTHSCILAPAFARVAIRLLQCPFYSIPHQLSFFPKWFQRPSFLQSCFCSSTKLNQLFIPLNCYLFPRHEL